MGKEISAISIETLKMLQDYDYPGNVRELENIIKRAVILSRDGGELESEHLLPESVPGQKQFSSGKSNGDTLADFERGAIFQTLNETEWRIGGKNGAAARLGLKRTTLISKMEKLGISRRLH